MVALKTTFRLSENNWGQVPYFRYFALQALKKIGNMVTVPNYYKPDESNHSIVRLASIAILAYSFLDAMDPLFAQASAFH